MVTLIPSRTRSESKPHHRSRPRHRAVDVAPFADGTELPRAHVDATHATTGPSEWRATRWLLVLVGEIVVFGALACLLARAHEQSPGAYAYGTRHLHVGLGTLTLIALGAGACAMLLASGEVHRGRRVRILSLLTIAAVAGVSVPILFGFEYSRTISWDMIRPRAAVTTDAPARATSTATFAAQSQAPKLGDLAKGQAAWKSTCRACHGVAGEGIPGQGKDIRGSQFIASKSDDQLIDFIKVGRMPFDPMNTTGIQMPPRGGNPLLKDQDLRDIVAYVRTFEPAEAASAADGAIAMKGGAEAGPGPLAVAVDSEIYIPKSVIPPAPPGPPGISFVSLTWSEYRLGSLAMPAPIDPRIDPYRPVEAAGFFRIFAIVGLLLSVHALVGLGWIVRAVRASCVKHTTALASNLSMGTRYWAMMTAIWLLMFPLLYLVR